MRLLLASLLMATVFPLLNGCAPLVVGGAAAGGVMVAQDRRTVGTMTEDEGIEQKTAARIGERFRDGIHVNVTSFNRMVLLTGEVAEVTPLRSAEFPVLRGRARVATGWLGNFDVVVDGYAAPAPSSRANSAHLRAWWLPTPCAPAMTMPRPSTASTATCITRRRSSSVSEEYSPSEPFGPTPRHPFCMRKSTCSANRS